MINPCCCYLSGPVLKVLSQNQGWQCANKKLQIPMSLSTNILPSTGGQEVCQLPGKPGVQPPMQLLSSQTYSF